MAKSKLKAKVRYLKQPDGREGYAVYIWSDGEWCMDTFFHLLDRNGSGEKDFLHYGFVAKLAHMQDLGYEIDLRIGAGSMGDIAG